MARGEQQQTDGEQMLTAGAGITAAGGLVGLSCRGGVLGVVGRDPQTCAPPAGLAGLGLKEDNPFRVLHYRFWGLRKGRGCPLILAFLSFSLRNENGVSPLQPPPYFPCCGWSGTQAGAGPGGPSWWTTVLPTPVSVTPHLCESQCGVTPSLRFPSLSSGSCFPTSASLSLGPSALVTEPPKCIPKRDAGSIWRVPVQPDPSLPTRYQAR